MLLQNLFRFVHTIRTTLSFASWTLLRVVFLLSILFIYFWSSLFIYLLFYYLYIPPVSHVQPIHLQFHSDCHNDGPVCSFPQATVRLRENQVLSAGQEYRVSVSLELPESDVNRRLGMFMVNLSFISANSDVLASSGRHFLLRYQSRLVRYMTILFYWLPLVLRFSEEKQLLKAEICEAYADSSNNPAEYALVTVLSRTIEIYSAEIRFDASFSGLRYLMYYWPITTALYVVSNLIFIKLVTTLLVWYLCSLASDDTEALDELDNDNDDDVDAQRHHPHRPLDGHVTAVENLHPIGQNNVTVHHQRPYFNLGDGDGGIPRDGSPLGSPHEVFTGSISGSPQMHRASSSASLNQLLAAQAARDSSEPPMPRSQSSSSLLHSRSYNRGVHLLCDENGSGLVLRPSHGLQGNRGQDDNTDGSRNVAMEASTGVLRHRAHISEST